MSGTILRKIGIESMDNTNNNTNDINALLLLLSERKTNGCYFDQRYHAALTALVAERDALARENETQTYKGNSVWYWNQKAEAYGGCIDSLWIMLSAAGYPPDGMKPIADALTALVAERDGLREQLRLANIDQFNTEAEANDRDRELREQLADAIKQREDAKDIAATHKRNWYEAAARLQSYRDLGQQVAQAQNESDALLFQLAEMQKQRDEARRDAERYRWLKSDRCYWVAIHSQPSGDLIFQGRHGHAFLHHSGKAEMDDVIDSAMRKGKS